MSTTPAASPADFLPSIRKRLAGFGFGSSQFDSQNLDGSHGNADQHRGFYREKLPISGEILPEVEKSLVDACQRLGIPRSSVHAFVRPSADMNAVCYSGIRGAAVIEINAGVIECLSPEELTYVIGHELGHYILPIRSISIRRNGHSQPASCEDARISRDNELTMDRFGLLACGDFKHAGSAILKMQSGLSSRHIRSDLAAFMENSRRAMEVDADEAEALSSHPPEFVRLRALNAFVMSDEFRKALGKEGGQPIAEINEGIRKDLGRAIDSFADKIMEDALGRLAQAIAAFMVANRVKVDTAALCRDGVQLDRDRVRGLAANLSQMSEDKRLEAFSNRLSEVISRCVLACPRRTYAYLDALISGVAGEAIADIAGKIKSEVEETNRKHLSA
jgi:hypothetical protein